jgi:hypothetical protein
MKNLGEVVCEILKKVFGNRSTITKNCTIHKHKLLQLLRGLGVDRDQPMGGGI